MTIVSARLYNRAAVLDAIFNEPEITRAGIRHATGLSLATVSRVVEDLKSEGLLDEGRRQGRPRRGRPTMFIELGSGVGCVVGLDLGASRTHLICGDLMCRTLSRQRIDTPTELDVSALERWVADAVGAVRSAAKTRRPLVCVGIGVPATVRNDGEVVRPAAKLAQIAGRELRERLGELLKVPVVLENEANVALLGEHASGAAAGSTDAVMLLVSTNFGAGVAMNGEMVRGRTGMVGEFGFIPTGEAGQSLRDLLSVAGITSAAKARGIELKDIAELFVASPSPDLVPLRDDFIRGLTLAISTATVAFDPQVVVMNGRLVPLVEEVLPTVEAELATVLPVVPQLRTTALGGFAGATGSTLLAVQAARHALKGLSPTQETVFRDAFRSVPISGPDLETGVAAGARENPR
jgi:predicted NBD/HSP70 family sugar kinase